MLFPAGQSREGGDKHWVFLAWEASGLRVCEGIEAMGGGAAGVSECLGFWGIVSDHVVVRKSRKKQGSPLAC